MSSSTSRKRVLRNSLSNGKPSKRTPSLIIVAGVCFGIASVTVLITSAYMALQLDPGESSTSPLRGGKKAAAVNVNTPSHTLNAMRAETRNNFARAQLEAHAELQQHKPPIIVDRHEGDATKNDATPGITKEQPPDDPTIVLEQFQKRYGKYADTIQSKGLQSFGSVEATAKRMLAASAAQRPFELAFAGYSITVGRGNYLSQSYPFVLERILKPVMQQSPLQLDVKVRNAAIGGIPSFPYGFCLSHFLGEAPDVISWDYSLNEGKQAAVYESYLRHSQHQFSTSRPMMIALDTNKQRCSMLQKYTELGLVSDGVCVGMAKDVLDVDDIVKQDEKDLPLGLQHWKEFGSPGGCPGRGSWHPKKMEHELIGWMLALYFAKALQAALDMIKDDKDWKTTHATAKSRSLAESSVEPIEFPPTIQTPPDNTADVTSLLYGHAISNSTTDEQKYVLNHISCRTSFLPAVDQDKVIPSIIVSGLAPNALGQDILEKRTDEAYQSGWVLDVSQLERETKIKVNTCDPDGLGYIDMKIALYGIPESGPLRLWLPLEGVRSTHDDSTLARHWFDGLVICEANEKRPEGACALDSDLEYSVGGVAVPSTRMVAGAAEYLKRKTCVNVGVPETARITPLKNVVMVDGDAPISQETRIRLAGAEAKDDDLGLVVDVKAKSNVSREKGACCLSHIVWEQH